MTSVIHRFGKKMSRGKKRYHVRSLKMHDFDKDDDRKTTWEITTEFHRH